MIVCDVLTNMDLIVSGSTCISAAVRTWSICRKYARPWRTPAVALVARLRTISAGGGLLLSRIDLNKVTLTSIATTKLERHAKSLAGCLRPRDSFGDRTRSIPGSGEADSWWPRFAHGQADGTKHVLLLDAGFNDLARPILYGSHHPISICRRDGDNTSVSEHPVVVGGPLCESGDIFTQEKAALSRDAICRQPKSAIIFILEVAGAYGFVMASNYNSKFGQRKC